MAGLTAAPIVRAARLALAEAPVKMLSIAVVDDGTMAELHRRYMADATPTDVLTFDLRDDVEAAQIEGEIVVSADTACRQALRRHIEPDQELLRYVIHGVLHLRGMNDDTAAGRQRMRRAETRVLNEIALARKSH